MSLPIPPQKAHLVALFDAYVEASGRELVFGPAYEPTLRGMDRRGITPADVRAVMQLIRLRMDKGASGYTEASLGWKRAMFDPLRFDDLLAEIRAARKRRAAKAAQAACTVPSAPVHAVPADSPDADEIAARVRAQAAEFRRQMGGGE